VRVDLAVLADYAAMTADNKLVICGVFDAILVRSFPAVHPAVALALRVVAGPEDRGGHRLEVRLTDPKGGELAKVQAEFSVAPPDDAVKAGSLQLVLAFGNVEFKEPGLHAVDILIDDRFEETAPLSVRQLEG